MIFDWDDTLCPSFWAKNLGYSVYEDVRGESAERARSYYSSQEVQQLYIYKAGCSILAVPSVLDTL